MVKPIKKNMQNIFFDTGSLRKKFDQNKKEK